MCSLRFTNQCCILFHEIGLHAVSLMDFLVKNCGVQYLAAFDERESVIRMGDFIKAKLEDHGINAKSTGQRRVAEALKGDFLRNRVQAERKRKKKRKQIKIKGKMDRTRRKIKVN